MAEEDIVFLKQHLYFLNVRWQLHVRLQLLPELPVDHGTQDVERFPHSLTVAIYAPG